MDVFGAGVRYPGRKRKIWIKIYIGDQELSGFTGRELALSPNAGLIEKLYIRMFGAPISGLQIRLRRVMPHVDGSPATILDAGCGRGVFSYSLARKFRDAKVKGIDLDDEQLEINRHIANKAGLDNLEFVSKDITRLDYEECFDLVVSVDNMEHLEDDRAGMKALYEALKPGGQLVLHVPGFERRWFLFGFQTNFDVPGHFRPGYTQQAIEELVKGAGFDIEYSHYTYGALETIANNISYVITGAAAKNKPLVAILFPLLNVISWLGRNAKPEKGAGVLVRAWKKSEKNK